MNYFINHKIAILYIILCVYSSFTISCAMDVPEKGYEYLAPPYIISCEQEGNNIIVEFRGYNDEYYFDGYNFYVSTTSMSRSLITSYKPVQVDEYASSTPSYPLSPDDYDPENVRRATLYHYYWHVEDTGEYIQFPFSAGTTYYIYMCSHHRLGYLFEEGVSNQQQVEFE